MTYSLSNFILVLYNINVEYYFFVCLTLQYMITVCHNFWMRGVPLFSSKTNIDNYAYELSKIESNDLLEISKGGREDIRDVVDEIHKSINRIKELCCDVENLAETQSSSSTSSTSDVICL